VGRKWYIDREKEREREREKVREIERCRDAKKEN
jgi:hypothetical protein